MSADIFISYRRGDTDSWIAGRLKDALKRQFSVFFDTFRESNDFGDNFAQRIDEALATCRVMFVVIGPDWVAGMSRLGDAGDWVSHELSAALARTDVRVIPLFASLQKVPDLTGLPAAISDLQHRVGEELNSDQWDIEASDLENRLKNNWLATQAKGSRTAQSEWDDALPYLCNRTPQEDDFIAWFSTVKADALTAPVTCVLHGYKEEAHQEFVERLESQRTLLEEVLSDDVPVAVQILQMNSEKLRKRQYVSAFMGAIKGSVLNRRTAPDEDVRAHLRALSQPLLLVLQLTWFDYEAIGSDLTGLIDAWRTLLNPAAGVQQSRLPYPVVLWINLTYEDVGAHAPNAPADSLLSELKTVTKGDIAAWAASKRVSALLGAAKRQKVIDLATDQRYYVVAGELHMRRFADGVRDVISAP